jgi:hypothetical protein
MMTKHVATAIAVALLTASLAAPGLAQTEKPATPEKKLSVQQQKMKDCGAKWKEEKAAKGVKGREAYRKFLSGCLKS